jgi:hypothetical protein
VGAGHGLRDENWSFNKRGVDLPLTVQGQANPRKE